MSEPADLQKPYDPSEVESRWYEFWEREGVFGASDDPADTRPVYVVPMPPPNVTGSLHMGHASRATNEDALVRWHRMRGFNTLWQPGLDHAGIATQTVVERQLAREGKRKEDLGREEFEKRIWAWRAESGGRIALQQRELGCSPDWARSKFTMDADQNRAVIEAFVRLHEQGLVYRATRLINWDPVQKTSLSDLEVEHEEQSGELFEFAYAVYGGGGGEIVVATTRPETMLADTAVAVHPDDARYTHLHGKRLQHPFFDRTIPIVLDAILVDPKFGTGAVKVTPAHDFNDFATGKRHGLEELVLFELDGTIRPEFGEFAGLTRERARTAVKKALADKDLARGSKPHRLTVPKSQRSGAIVEPMISTQWFVKMDGMAKRALEAVREGQVDIVPAEWKKTYEHFLENIQDWCISRQLWWGHQIPAWHGPNGEIAVGRERPVAAGAGWVQDPDVLDTWFSSALWPFATQGWPAQTDALKKFYPASDLETGYDILFFWVARMIMFGLHFTDQVPFRRVLLSGLIVDESGDKMSKVKGNVIDPLDLIHGTDFEKMVAKTLPGAPVAEALAKFKKAYPSAAAMGTGFPAFGADALRFTLASFPPSNKRIALAPKRIEGYRHFLNKVWNATRLVVDLVGTEPAPAASFTPTTFFGTWILARLSETAAAVHQGLDTFRIDEATTEIYRFFWTEFCDWYLELAKTQLRGDSAEADKAETRKVLLVVLEASLRLLHPLVPYVTEDLWQRLPRFAGRKSSIALGPYPAAAEYSQPGDAAVLAEMRLFQAAVSAARTVRSEREIHPSGRVRVAVRCDSADIRASFERLQPFFAALVKTEGDLVVAPLSAERTPGTAVCTVADERGLVEIRVDLRGHVTRAQEFTRIEREGKRIDKDLGAVDKKLGSKGFAERAPAEVVAEAHAQRAALVSAREQLAAAHELAVELEE